MIRQNTKEVFLFTKDLNLIQWVRKNVYSLDIPIQLSINYTEPRENLPPNILIIDQRFFKQQITSYQQINTKIIYLTDNFSVENLEVILKLGSDNILFFPINYDFLFCLIKKYLGMLKINEYKTFTHRGITVCRDSSSLTYNNCKIFLTDCEFEIVKAIMTNSIDENISKQSLQVTVCRINKKSKNGVGIKLIKNRRKRGYYISI